MKNNKKRIILLSMVILLSFFGKSLSVQAKEGGEGQVNRGGKILFYEETTESTRPIEDSSEIPSEEPKVVKPKGRLPQTGEFVQQYGWIGGVISIIGFLLFFLRKRRKEAS